MSGFIIKIPNVDGDIFLMEGGDGFWWTRSTEGATKYNIISKARQARRAARGSIRPADFKRSIVVPAE